MMKSAQSACYIVTLIGIVLFSRAGSAQTADSSCSYVRCALGLNPTLMSLDVVRGTSNERVASLNFFLPRDPSRTFAGNDSASAYARQATATRRTAATLTDLGIGFLAVAAGEMTAKHRLDRTGAAWMTAGAAIFAVSFPVQLRADGYLSRAVWWYNTRFR